MGMRPGTLGTLPAKALHTRWEWFGHILSTHEIHTQMGVLRPHIIHTSGYHSSSGSTMSRVPYWEALKQVSGELRIWRRGGRGGGLQSAQNSGKVVRVPGGWEGYTRGRLSVH